MMITVLKSKIAYGTITQKELFYVGSITIDEDIMKKANIRENEKVQVVNLNNGERLETYAIKGKAGSRVFCLNGAAARKAEVGDKIFIISYAQINESETLEPIIVDLEHYEKPMLLCLDVGNTHIFAGVFDKENLTMRFRYATHMIGTADQFGIFLLNILQFNKINPEKISAVAVSSVVPSSDFTLRHAISLYFKNATYFTLQAGVKTGLNIKYKNPKEVGADKIANAIGAVNTYPDKNLIVVDMGTATTICAINNKRDYLGGTILAGMRLAMESLKSNTAKLMAVDIEEPSSYLGQTTRESIQAGLYYGQLGALKEIVNGFKSQLFNGESVTVIGTGGFSQLYKDKSLFNVILPDLVLFGLNKAYQLSL